MRHLFDFGISQEDPVTEYRLLDIRPFDKVLCIASGGEMPLSLLCLQPDARITAVDISPAQLMLCRLKMQASLQLTFPKNGEFLGFSSAGKKWRREVYHDLIHGNLPKEDQHFWLRNLRAIQLGIVNQGRFEGYMKRIRGIVRMIVGRHNIEKLLTCSSLVEQKIVFDRHIGNRKAVKSLFRVAFHPAIYRNRGLNAQGLIHASSKTGQVFYNKFRDFCTRNPANENYFLQYFLTGECRQEAAFPVYLQEKYRSTLALSYDNIRWKHKTLQNELEKNPPGTFNKIHLSNIGDWMSDEEFSGFLDILCRQSIGQVRICYRFLQKKHFINGGCCGNRFEIHNANGDKYDRFPFYSILSISNHE